MVTVKQILIKKYFPRPILLGLYNMKVYFRPRVISLGEVDATDERKYGQRRHTYRMRLFRLHGLATLLISLCWPDEILRTNNDI